MESERERKSTGQSYHELDTPSLNTRAVYCDLSL